MRLILVALIVFTVAVGPVVPAAVAGEQADWGKTVAMGTINNALLLQNDTGFRLLVVDADADIRGPGLRPMTLTDIRLGDHIDYAFTLFGGMRIATTLHVTPPLQRAALP